MDAPAHCQAEELQDFGLIAATGADARAFLHAQLTNDVEHLPPDEVRYAGWCSAKGRLLATFLAIPQDDGILLQVARDLVAPIRQRLQMFVLRSKVTLADAGAAWAQFGVWGQGAAGQLGVLGVAMPARDGGVARAAGLVAIRISAQRILLLARPDMRAALASRLERAGQSSWALEEIRAGRPHVMRATQDLFVPQMLNLERVGGVDFRKGCYPGQEVVARTQYRGQLKRRMVRLRVALALRPGQDLYCDDAPGQPSGTVVNAAGGEALAVLPIASLESGVAVRAAPDGDPLEVLPLPYAA